MDFISAVIFAGIAFVLAVRTFFVMAVWRLDGHPNIEVATPLND